MSRTLMFHIDGTCNDPFDANDASRSLLNTILGRKENKSISNVLKLHLLAGGNMDNSRGNVPGQHSFYYSGIGTRGGPLERALNAALAPRRMDVQDILDQVGRDLANHYQPGDKIMLFGFSRGAALARMFASRIADYLPEGVAAEESVEYLGAFDTVASIGFPNLDDDTKPMSDVVFEDDRVAPSVKRTLHLVAIDERRNAFRPVLMHQDPRITEVWMAGAHTDIGGGFDHDGLSDIALSSMMQHAQEHTGIQYLMPRELNYAKINGDEGYGISYRDMAIRPDHLSMIHKQDESRLLEGWWLGDRDVRISEGWAAVEDHPRVHVSVVARIQDTAHLADAYRPEPLQGVTYRVDSLEPDAPLAIARGSNALPAYPGLANQSVRRDHNIQSTLDYL